VPWTRYSVDHRRDLPEPPPVTGARCREPSLLGPRDSARLGPGRSREHAPRSRQVAWGGAIRSWAARRDSRRPRPSRFRVRIRDVVVGRVARRAISAESWPRSRRAKTGGHVVWQTDGDGELSVRSDQNGLSAMSSMDGHGQAGASLLIQITARAVQVSASEETVATMLSLGAWLAGPTINEREDEVIDLDPDRGEGQRGKHARRVVHLEGRLDLPSSVDFPSAASQWIDALQAVAGEDVPVDIDAYDMGRARLRVVLDPTNYPIREPRYPIYPKGHAGFGHSLDGRRLTKERLSAIADQLGPEAASTLARAPAPPQDRCGFCRRKPGQRDRAGDAATLIRLTQTVVCSSCAATLADGLPASPGVVTTSGNPPLEAFTADLGCNECGLRVDSARVVEAEVNWFGLCRDCLLRALSVGEGDRAVK
jgi:hypothetical protein